MSGQEEPDPDASRYRRSIEVLLEVYTGKLRAYTLTEVLESMVELYGESLPAARWCDRCQDFHDPDAAPRSERAPGVTAPHPRCGAGHLCCSDRRGNGTAGAPGAAGLAAMFHDHSLAPGECPACIDVGRLVGEAAEREGLTSLGDVLVVIGSTDNPYTATQAGGETRVAALQAFRDGRDTSRCQFWHGPVSGGARLITRDDVDWRGLR